MPESKISGHLSTWATTMAVGSSKNCFLVLACLPKYRNANGQIHAVTPQFHMPEEKTKAVNPTTRNAQAAFFIGSRCFITISSFPVWRGSFSRDNKTRHNQCCTLLFISWQWRNAKDHQRLYMGSVCVVNRCENFLMKRNFMVKLFVRISGALTALKKSRTSDNPTSHRHYSPLSSNADAKSNHLNTFVFSLQSKETQKVHRCFRLFLHPDSTVFHPEKK